MVKARGSKMPYALSLPLSPRTSAGWPSALCIYNGEGRSEIYCGRYNFYGSLLLYFVQLFLIVLQFF